MASKKKSHLWTYFENYEKDPKIVVCKLCGANISRGGVGKKASTSGMINHLEINNNDENRKLQLPKRQETMHRDNNADEAKVSKRQLSLEECSQMTKQWDVNDPKAKKYHRLIAEMIALDNQAANIVERKGFRRLINSALPRYNIPSRPYFSEKIIPELYQKGSEDN